MKTFTHHYLLANEKILPFQDRIEAALQDVEEKVLAKLQAVSVDVVVIHCPHRTIPELGIVGSYTRDAKLIEIVLDVDHAYLREHLEEEIKRTLAHEYMHAVREEYVRFEEGTLLDSIIAEGLTQSFEIEVNPGVAPAIYSTYLSEKELPDTFENMKPHLNDVQYDHNTWFFGNEEKGIKKWIGYSVGFWLVQAKIKKEGKPASELVKLDSGEFVGVGV